MPKRIQHLEDLKYPRCRTPQAHELHAEWHDNARTSTSTRTHTRTKTHNTHGVHAAVHTDAAVCGWHINECVCAQLHLKTKKMGMPS